MRSAPPIIVAVFCAAVIASIVVLYSNSRKLSTAPSGSQSRQSGGGKHENVSDTAKPNGSLSLPRRSIPSANEIERWKSSLDLAEAELRLLRNSVPKEQQILTGYEYGEMRFSEILSKAGVNMQDKLDLVGGERQALLRSPRLQSGLLEILELAGSSRLSWDKVHGGPYVEKWLSPVYRRTVRDWVMMDPTAYLGGRIRFLSQTEYLPYAGVDIAVANLVLSNIGLPIEWAWKRRDSVPATSCDILVQTLIVDSYRASLGADGKFEGKVAERLRDMVVSRNPTFRLLALSLADSFEPDFNALVSICQHASVEVNQIFWKTALQKLEVIGGPLAADAARAFILTAAIPSDGTAFPDDSDIVGEINKLVGAVEARRSR